MGTIRRSSSVRALLAVVAAALGMVAMACAPEAGGPPPSTTSTTTSTTLPWSTPTGQWTGFNLTCGVSVFGVPYTFPQSASVNVDAPAVVSQGQTFFSTVAPGPFLVPTEVQGYALQDLFAFTIRFPLSPNVELVDSVMSAGINMGPGYPSLTQEGDQLVYRVPGPFAPGSEVQMPKVRLELKATGASGSTIETRMQTLSNVANFGILAVDNICTPNAPSPLFWSTLIL